MDRPLDRGAPIDEGRYAAWLARFAGYRDIVTRPKIEEWLRQFGAHDQDLAARILDAVLFLRNQDVYDSFRQMLARAAGWNKAQPRRRGRWFFVPFSGSAGESGDTMVHALRVATRMTSKRYNNLFIHRSELPSQNPSQGDTVVLVDDFSGTGKQACDSWPLFEELLSGGPRVLLMLVAATEAALRRIAEQTGMDVTCARTLRQGDNIFDPHCTHFTGGEKIAVLRYCERAAPRQPRGFGDAGLVVVLAHRTPNNSIPILHSTRRTWTGLFPRNG